jgi:hypothetical protein
VQRLVEGQQCPCFLLDAGGVAGTQDPAVPQGVAQREVGDLNRPPLMPVKRKLSLA